VQRREFITLLGSAAAAWPFAARAQTEKLRRVGILINVGADNANAQANLATFIHSLEQLGWTIGQNVQIETR
jgi:putative ABC transport system substrate-binding protein